MFTGLIEELGTIQHIQIDPQTGQSILTIYAAIILDTNTQLGDSIAVNGVCLTVTSYDLKAHLFTVGLSPETLRRTNFSKLQVNDNVNLERSLPVNGKIGGHYVQGHVDTIGRIHERHIDGDMLVVQIHIENLEWFMYIVEKGYIAIDGTSLTVTAVDLKQHTFSVMLIQYTQQKIVLSRKTVNDLVNIEVDILGKYFINFMKHFAAQIPTSKL